MVPYVVPLCSHSRTHGSTRPETVVERRHEPPANGTQAVDRAAELRRTVVRADEPLGLRRAREAAGLAKSTASRLLPALERTGCSSATTPACTSPARSSRCTPPARPLGRAGPAGPPDPRAARRRHRRDRQPRGARGTAVVQVAQVDAAFLLGTPRLDRGRRPAALLRAGQGASTPTAAARAPDGPLSGRTPHASPTVPSCARQLARSAAAATPSPSTSSRSG